MSVIALPTWHYPHWIAHRGAGRLAPENTMAALRMGAQYGYRMVEFDVKVSSDGIPFLMHDNTLLRTTNAEELFKASALSMPSECRWEDLCKLDVGSWHSRLFAGECIPTLENVARFCIRNGIAANIEIKPCPGSSERTGRLVAEYAAQLWTNIDTPPLLTSFDVDALKSAKAQRPDLPYGLLLDHWWDGWFEFAKQLGCVAIVAANELWNNAHVSSVHHQGMRALSYTINAVDDVQRLMQLHVDGLITDNIDQFTPD